MGLKSWLASKIDEDPILLSHHPLCGKFDDHMFKVRGRNVCIGCVTVYPSAVVSALLLAATGHDSLEFVVLVALLAFAANFPRFLVKGHRFSVLFNVFLGTSLGAALLAAVHAPDDIQLVVIVLGLAVGIAFSALKGHRVFATCKRCERYHEFPECRGPESSPSREHPP
jgi:hypothetical protein